jgi:Protein of unknown function (DUF2815)
MILTLTKVILSFADLWVMRPGMKGGQPAFACNLLMAKDDPQGMAVVQAMVATAKDRWPGIEPRTGKPLHEFLIESFAQDGRLPLRDGDRKAYTGYEGRRYLSCRSQRKPLVVNRDPVLRNADGTAKLGPDGKPLPNLITQESGILYAGCIVNAGVDVWPQDNEWGQRIGCEIRWVQYVQDGDAFSGSKPAQLSELPNLAMPAPAGGIQQAALRQATAALPNGSAQVMEPSKPFDARSLL